MPNPNKKYNTTDLAGYMVQLYVSDESVNQVGFMRVKVGYEWTRWYDLGDEKDTEIFYREFPEISKEFLRIGIASSPKTRIGDDVVIDIN